MLMPFLWVASFQTNVVLDSDEQWEILEEEMSISQEPLKDPCKLLSSAEIESTDGFENSSEGILHKASGNTYKQCDFLVDKRQMGVVFRRLNQKEIELKKLESNYKFYLKQDAYTEVENVPGDQAMFSFTQTKSPSGVKYAYSLQWRYGNHTERKIGISYADEQNRSDVLSSLVELANKLED